MQKWQGIQQNTIFGDGTGNVNASVNLKQTIQFVIDHSGKPVFSRVGNLVDFTVWKVVIKGSANYAPILQQVLSTQGASVCYCKTPITCTIFNLTFQYLLLPIQK